jgi:predicted Fe-S protein YdhL (DUF1289 family)
MDSPCIGVCRLTPDGQACTGCTRTIEEISGWAKMPRADREAVMRRCLENVWGTKCKDCMTLRGKDQQQEERSRVEGLPPAPF